jgi:hypothetical protein
MLRVEMLPARQGDALWIEYGEDPQRPHRVLYDAGTPGTWSVLQARIAELPEDRRAFELLVVSHVDADHIGGSLPLLADARLGATFDDVWFNGWRHLPRTRESLGPVQGERLSALLAERSWNAAWDGRTVVVPGDGALPSRTLPGGLRLTLLSPGPEQLARLQPVWGAEVRKAGLEPGVPATPLQQRPGLEALGRSPVPDIDALAATSFEEDRAEANGSSIATLAEYGGRSTILAADAHPTVVAASVRRLLKERGAQRLKLSALKLPHHGSRANNSRELLALVETGDFLVSTDGTQTQHPHPETIARVLAEHPESTLWFNYRTRYTGIWGRDDVIARYGHVAHLPDGTPGTDIELGTI